MELAALQSLGMVAVLGEEVGAYKNNALSLSMLNYYSPCILAHVAVGASIRVFRRGFARCAALEFVPATRRRDYDQHGSCEAAHSTINAVKH